jgi:hypothetical protein
MEKELFTEDIKAILRETFKELRDEVSLEVFTQKGINDDFNEIAAGLVTTISDRKSVV